MNTENTIEVDDLRADIENAVNELSENKSEQPVEAETKSDQTEDQSSEEVQQPEEEKVQEIEAPKSWDAVAKEKFKTLPRDVQEFIKNREEEIHKGFTKQDDERTFGKRLKEVINPYMPIIQAEGGNPETAIRDLLNTAYALRTSPLNHKVELVKQICQTYDIPVDQLLSVKQNNEYVDPTLRAILQEVQQVKQIANPETLKRQLQEQLENDRINAEVNAFASDPANEYYETVKPIMASLLASGVVSTMKEAYDRALLAHPQIGSIIEAKKSAEMETKKKAELAAKKKAAVSVSGSSSNAVANAKTFQKTLNDDIADDIRAAMQEHGFD